MKQSYHHYRITDFLEDQTFISYVKGSDPKHVKYWKTWLEENPPNRDQAEEAHRIISMMGHGEQPSVPFSKEVEFDGVMDRIRHNELIRGKSGIRSYRTWRRLAAAVIVMLSLGLGSLLVMQNIFQDNEVVYNEITVPKGSRTRIALEDGSVIWLNAESTLKYPSDFSGSERSVELTGEAYFEVSKDPKNPFVVRTADIRINVLGTSFNVKAYPNEDKIETTLESGLVHVKKYRDDGEGEEIILLKPNQKLVLYKSTMSAEITEIAEEEIRTTEKAAVPTSGQPKKPGLYLNYETELATSWKDGKLIFKGESLGILASRLEKWYDVNIQIADSGLYLKSYTGIFENETVEQAMEALCLASDLNFTIDKNNIVIYEGP